MRSTCHYVVSNEQRFDLVAPLLHARGGALVGVGTDQNYTMAAMAQSSLVFIVDYDSVVPLVHEMYGVLVPTSAIPRAAVARRADVVARGGHRAAAQDRTTP